MAAVTHLPTGARFTCQGCGRCCQGWNVPVDRATADRLRAKPWGADPFVATPGASHEFRIRMVDGRCFFLDATNRCRIQTELSYDAKPHACRAFPLAVFEVDDSRHARLSYWCPTVVANAGKPLEHQAAWTKEVARHAEHRGEPISINGGRPLSTVELRMVHGAIQRRMGAVEWPFADRLAAVAGVVQRLAGSAGDVRAILDVADRAGADVLAAEVRRSGSASGGRRALALYLVFDWEGGRLRMLSRTASVLLAGFGLLPLRSRAVEARARWSTLRRVAFGPPESVSELLDRYFASKVEARAYLTHEATVLSGVNRLVIAYGVVRVLAQLRAAAAGRSRCEDDDVRAAVAAADLLVLEHGGNDHGRLHVQLTGSVLSDRRLPADVFACLGAT